MLEISCTELAAHSKTRTHFLAANAATRKTKGLVTDSRLLEEDLVFLAIKGERFDANSLVVEAISQGVSAVIMTAEPNAEQLEAAKKADVTLLQCIDNDYEESLLALASYWRDLNPQWKLIGVTGSVGKTTTKDMLASAIAACGKKVHATKGNFNNLVGLPLTLFSASPEDEFIVLEMGMNHFNEISRLSRAAKPNLALLTNIGTSHIGILGSRENIARAKAEILEGMDPSKEESALICVDDNDFVPFIKSEFADKANIKIKLVSARSNTEAELYTLKCNLNVEGMVESEICRSGHTLKLNLNVPGSQVLKDALLALEACASFGLDLEKAISGIETMEHTAMRLEIKKVSGKPQIIDDSYNASPSSVAAALEVLSKLECKGRRIAVLGEVGELGDQAEKLHGYMGAYAAAFDLDLYIFVGSKMAEIMADAARTMGASEDKIEVVETAEAAVELFKDVFVETDLILAKASRSVGLDRFVKGVLA